MTAKEILVQARGYIEKGWCRGQYALTSAGSPCRANSGEAVAWCALGALRAADPRGDGYLSPEGYAAKALLEKVAAVPLIWWNDDATKEEVLAAFDKAIELADKEAE